MSEPLKRVAQNNLPREGGYPLPTVRSAFVPTLLYGTNRQEFQGIAY